MLKGVISILIISILIIHIKKVLLGFEPRWPDSKSEMLTITS